MDKFEKLIKQSVEGYEAPFNPQAWENVSNELGDSFEQMMKDSTSGYEAPFNPSAWEAVSSQLGPANSTWKWIGGSAAVIALVAGISYFADTTETTNEITNHPSTDVIVQNNDGVDYQSVLAEDENITTTNTISSEELSVQEDELANNNPIQHLAPDLNTNTTQVHVNDQSGSITVNVNNTTNNTQTVVADENNTPNNDHTVISDASNELKADARFTVSTYDMCLGSTCTFTPEEANTSLLYSWSFGDGEISNSMNPSHKFKKAGEFIVSLTVKNPKTYKILGSRSETVIVHELPKTEFNVVRSSEAIPSITFENTTPNSTVVLWNIKGIKQSTNPEFSHTFRKEGIYTVELTAKNELGCSSTAQQRVSINEDYNLLAPTAFSPNGDGKYDNFIPLALTVMEVDFTMTILDKTGKLVYSTQNAYEPWDGRYTEDNKLAPFGSSYIWRVVLTNKMGEKEFYEGQVFVVN